MRMHSKQTHHLTETTPKRVPTTLWTTKVGALLAPPKYRSAPMPSEDLTRKARRLALDGSVRKLNNRGGVSTADVVGDHSTYRVSRTDDGIFESCTCPSVARCSHIEAVRLAAAPRRREGNPMSENTYKSDDPGRPFVDPASDGAEDYHETVDIDSEIGEIVTTSQEGARGRNRGFGVPESTNRRNERPAVCHHTRGSRCCSAPTLRYTRHLSNSENHIRNRVRPPRALEVSPKQCSLVSSTAASSDSDRWNRSHTSTSSTAGPHHLQKCSAGSSAPRATPSKQPK